MKYRIEHADKTKTEIIALRVDVCQKNRILVVQSDGSVEERKLQSAIKRMDLIKSEEDIRPVYIAGVDQPLELIHRSIFENVDEGKRG